MERTAQNKVSKETAVGFSVVTPTSIIGASILLAALAISVTMYFQQSSKR